MWADEHKQIQSATYCTSSKTKSTHRNTKVKITREREKKRKQHNTGEKQSQRHLLKRRNNYKTI